MEITKIEAASEFNLFDLFAKCQVVGDKRVANDDECRAYARWLAMKAGVVEAVTNSPVLEWKYSGRKHSDKICIGAYFGNAFVTFPGADQNGAVTFELLDESGNVETSGTIYAKPNGALNVSPSDAAAIKESGKAWAKANKGKAKAVPVAVAAPIDEPAPVAALPDELDAPECAPETPQDDAPATTLAETPEIAPQDEKNGVADDIEAQPDPIAALIARIEALEAAINGAKAGSATKSENQDDLSTGTPSVGISEPAPLSGELKPKRSPAHIRAIIAYLAMRKERNSERKHNAIGMAQLDEMRKECGQWRGLAESSAAECLKLRKERDDYEGLQQRTWEQAMGYKMQRRRAILKALALRGNLKRSRDIATDRLKQIVDMSDRLISESSKATTAETCARSAESREAKANAELADIKRKLADPANPFRLSDMVAINDKAGEYQARAERAEAESERLRRLAIQNAGHIETLASRIAKAETMLRDSGLMPALSIVPPSVEIAA
jgi:hypothetical protein